MSDARPFRGRRPESRADLAKLPLSGWERWLREELGAWLLPIPLDGARRPFYPLFVPVDDTDPGGTLAYEVRLSCGGRTETPARAAQRVLAEWSLALDSIAGPELLLRVCEYLNAPRLQAAIEALLDGAPPMTLQERDRLGRAIVAATEARLRPSQLAALAEMLARTGFYSPLVAAELIAARANTRLETIDLLIAGSPLETKDGHGPDYQHLVGRLMEQYPAPRLEMAWSRLPNIKIGRRLLQALSDLMFSPAPRLFNPPLEVSTGEPASVPPPLPEGFGAHGPTCSPEDPGWGILKAAA